MSNGDSIFFKFRVNKETREAIDVMVETEYINPTIFARQAFHNELVRRGYLHADLIGIRSPYASRAGEPDVNAPQTPDVTTPGKVKEPF